MKAMPLSLSERRELAMSDRRFQPFLSELQSSIAVGDSPDVTGDSFEDLKVEPLLKCTPRKNIMSTLVNVKNSSFLVFLTRDREGVPVLLMNKHVYDRCPVGEWVMSQSRSVTDSGKTKNLVSSARIRKPVLS